MDVRESLTLEKPEDLRRWLQENGQTKIEIWLIFYKKSSGQQTLTIAQAVEEALCFGWIDGEPAPLVPRRPPALNSGAAGATVSLSCVLPARCGIYSA